MKMKKVCRTVLALFICLTQVCIIQPLYAAEEALVPKTLTFGFQSDDEDTVYATGGFGTDFMDVWDITFDLYEVISRAPATIKADGDNKYLSVDAYFVAEYMDTVTDKYEFSAEMRTGGPEYLGGIFVHAASTLFPFYDSDGYMENGGASTTTNESFIACSGIAFVPVANGFRIYVKTYENDGKGNKDYGVGNEYAEFALSYETKSKFTKLSFTEENGVINVSLDGIDIASVSMSAPGEYENVDVECYKTVVIKDTNGSEVKRVNNALVTVDNYMAIALRGATHIDFDNISVTTYVPEQEATPEPTESSKANETAAPAPTKTSDSNTSAPDGQSGYPVLYIAVGVAVIAAVAVILIIVIKRKKIN